MTPKIQKVFDSIRRGETELKWKMEVDPFRNNSRSMNAYIDGLNFIVWSSRSFSEVNCWEDYQNFKNFPQNKKIKTYKEGQQFCQEWYNNYLIQEASKEMEA